jgi:predicted patatin/cPLA2 family phospholipase
MARGAGAMKVLVLEGGGMRAGFVAGAVMALMDKGLNRFDRGFAVSASVPTLTYFAAGQRKDIDRIWRGELTTSKLVSYKNIPVAPFSLSVERPILDIDYLVYEVLKSRFPLDLERLHASEMECYFAATQVQGALLRFLTPGMYDIYEIFRACMALPGCYPGVVCMGDDEFLDGGVIHPLPLEDRLLQGAEKIVVILSKPLDKKDVPLSLWRKVLFWQYFKKYHWVMERLSEAACHYNEKVSQLSRIPFEGSAQTFIIAPDRMPPAPLITRDPDKINKTVNLGYGKVIELESPLRRFLDQEEIPLGYQICTPSGPVPALSP